MLQMSQASKKIMVDSIASLSYLMHARKTYYYAHLMPSCKMYVNYNLWPNELMFELPNIKLE